MKLDLVKVNWNVADQRGGRGWSLWIDSDIFSWKIAWLTTRTVGISFDNLRRVYRHARGLAPTSEGKHG